MLKTLFLLTLIAFTFTLGILLLKWTFDSGMENCIEVPEKTICINE